jgi:hypothetical protein
MQPELPDWAIQGYHSFAGDRALARIAGPKGLAGVERASRDRGA